MRPHPLGITPKPAPQFFAIWGPRLGLRRVCALNLGVLALAVAAAALAFGAIPPAGGLHPATMLFLGFAARRNVPPARSEDLADSVAWDRPKAWGSPTHHAAPPQQLRGVRCPLGG